MESIEQMLDRLCPEGVKVVKLGDCLKYEQPSKYQVSSKDYIDEGIPVLTAGQTFILGYTNEINGVYHASKEKPVIIFDDFTTSFHWVDFDFKVKSSAMKLLTPNNEQANFRFVYYAMKCIKYETLEHSRQWISTYSQIEIPLPPLEVQNRIVEILDKMTSLTAELEAELEAELDCRKRQYEYYRDKLLTFNEIGGGNRQVEWKKLGEVCEILTGFPFDSNKFTETGIKLTRCMNVKRGVLDYSENNYKYWETSNGLEKYLLAENDVIIAMDGSLVGKSFGIMRKEYLPSLLVQRVARIRSEKVNIQYVFFWINNSFSEYVDKKKTLGAVPHISMKDISDFPIPVPPLSEQSRIVSILDRFEALTSDLQNGLPAEIEARRQQYEYYRNKLLTFKTA